VTRMIHLGRPRTRLAGAGGATVLAAALVAALLAGCATAPSAATGDVTVPTPVPPTVVASPSGTPAPVPPANPTCPDGVPVMDSVPAMSPMPAPGHMPAGSTMEAIKEKRGYLLAGVDQDEFDLGYPNPSPTAPPGEAYLGFDIDILHALAYAIFGNPDAIRFVPVAEDFRLGAANDGLVDVVAASITITCERKAQARFSVDYLDAAQELLVPRDVNTISVTTGPGAAPHVNVPVGDKVCTIGSTTSVANLTSLAKADGFSVVLADNWSDCLVMLQQGQVQAASTDSSVLGGIAAEDPYLKVVGQPFSHEPHGLAFPLSDPYSTDNAQFVSFANGVILGLEAHSHGGYCPEPQLSTDVSCWAALYRTWIEAGLTPGTVPAPPTPMFSG
jgi:polar amino acid transport system substrate-binding protein